MTEKTYIHDLKTALEIELRRYDPQVDPESQAKKNYVLTIKDFRDQIKEWGENGQWRCQKGAGYVSDGKPFYLETPFDILNHILNYTFFPNIGGSPEIDGRLRIWEHLDEPKTDEEERLCRNLRGLEYACSQVYVDSFWLKRKREKLIRQKGKISDFVKKIEEDNDCSWEDLEYGN
jgi:hypothetical protein